MSRHTRSLVAALAVSGATLFPAVAGAQATSPSGSGTVTAIGSAVVAPDPGDRNSNTSIRKAVARAQTAVLPLAIRAARARARVLAAESGLTLGALVGIADQPPSPFSPFGIYGVEGTFGPGSYCGNVARYRTVRMANGTIRRTRLGTRRLCRVPNRVGATVSATYATAAAPTG